jgi:deoxyadenosine/deoxycytidine kinase
MTVPQINPLGKMAFNNKSGKVDKLANSEKAAVFSQAFTDASKKIYQEVPKAYTAYEGEFKKHKVVKKPRFDNDAEEDEDDPEKILAQIEKRLKRLDQMTEDK